MPNVPHKAKCKQISNELNFHTREFNSTCTYYTIWTLKHSLGICKSVQCPWEEEVRIMSNPLLLAIHMTGTNMPRPPLESENCPNILK